MRGRKGRNMQGEAETGEVQRKKHLVPRMAERRVLDPRKGKPGQNCGARTWRKRLLYLDRSKETTACSRRGRAGAAAAAHDADGRGTQSREDDELNDGGYAGGGRKGGRTTSPTAAARREGQKGEDDESDDGGAPQGAERGEDGEPDDGGCAAGGQASWLIPSAAGRSPSAKDAEPLF